MIASHKSFSMVRNVLMLVTTFNADVKKEPEVVKRMT